MELIVLVVIPSLFILFFPVPLISVLLSIAAGTRLCDIFCNRCRANLVKTVELWSLGGAGMSFAVVVYVGDPRLRAALIYFSTMLAAKFIISFIVCREHGSARTFETMRSLNTQLLQSLYRLKTEHELIISRDDCPQEELARHLVDKRRQLHELERQYAEQIKLLTLRLDDLNDENRRKMHGIELQREEAQQIIFDLQERLDRAHDRLERSTECHVLDGKSLDAQEVRRWFEEALRRTEHELDIFSPCMSFKVVRSIKPQLRELLSNPSITIKIRYSVCDQSDARNKITQKVAKMLRKEFKHYPNFEMYRDEARAKLFICDEKFCVASGFNVLSFEGSFDDDIGGEYSENLETLRAYRAKYFDFKGESS
ncbi:MAG: hypothetical protein IJ668_05350 [Selenomonadaceae bacterium]|nr:hypothetical protein [Selenomonadaceae bacterium]